MGGRTWSIYEAQARALGEEKEFQRVRALAEAFQEVFGEEQDVRQIRERLFQVLASRAREEDGHDRQIRSRRSDRLLNVREVAERLHVHPETVLRATAAGKLPVMRLGRTLRFRPEDVDKYIERNVEGG